MTSDDIDKDVENLHKAVNDRQWFKVLDLYKKKKDLRTVQVTSAGDTVLHMAVSEGYTEIVERMVDFVCNPENEEAPDSDIGKEQDKKKPTSFVNENGYEHWPVLWAKNEKGDTPLHLAASLGNIKICKLISGKDPSLIVEPNITGGTPLFVAALHGKKDTFLWLYYLYKENSSTWCVAHYKRSDGDTILHCAIAKGAIDLAIEIVLLYKDYLAKMIKRNENGLTPLHVLAATPSVFESTDPHGRLFVGQLIYRYFLRVKDKEQATTKGELERRDRELFFIQLVFLCIFCKYCSSSLQYM